MRHFYPDKMEAQQPLSQTALFVKYNIQVVYVYTSLNVNHVLKDILQKGNTSLTSINPLKPNDPYSGRTAPLTSKVSFYIFIQQI